VNLSTWRYKALEPPPGLDGRIFEASQRLLERMMLSSRRKYQHCFGTQKQDMLAKKYRSSLLSVVAATQASNHQHQGRL